MDYAIVYSSKTGNTAVLAKSLRETLPGYSCSYYGTPNPKALKASLLFVGFWTDKGTCDVDTAAFLKTLEGKQIALFGTAGFGSDETYYKEVLGRVKKNIKDSNKVTGEFMCQGRMLPTVLEKAKGMLAKNPHDEMAQSLKANYYIGLEHPDEIDRDRLNQMARQILL